MEIKDNYMLITGANRGIGRAVAEMAAKDGAHLILCNRTQNPDLVKELEALGAPSAREIITDLSSKSGVDQLLSQLEGQRIDILFNNAGQLTGGLLEEQSLDEIYSMIQVNISSLIHLTHALLPRMIASRRGKVINHSSVSGVMHFPCSSTYSATKAAVLAFSNSLRSELVGTGVSCLVLVTPGVETRMFNEIPEKYGKNLDVSLLKSIPSRKYAQMIREAILEDLDTLKPHGVTGFFLRAAQHTPRIFEKLVLKNFKR